MDLARVVGVNWDQHSVDLVSMTSGQPMCGVRVMSQYASTNTGLNSLVTPDLPNGLKPGEQFDKGGNTGTRDIIACVAFFDGLPIVQGFLFPQTSQMLFSDKDRKIDRHSSDVYSSITKDGDFEFSHPSGAFVRVAVASAHEDLTGKDADGLWKIARNTDKQVHIHVEQAGGTYIDIAPNGNVEVSVQGTVSVTSTGTATVNSPTIDLKGAGGATKGLVTGDCMCSYTGAPHPQVSATVKGAI
jgi:hypothetical protein